MIKIELRLFADLIEYQPQNSLAYEVEESTTIKQLLSTLGIDEIKAKIIFVNGQKKGFDHTLKHDDRVGIFPPVGGG